MNNKIVLSAKRTSAIFLAIVLIAGTIAAVSSPSFIIKEVNAQGDLYYENDNRHDSYYELEHLDKKYISYEPEYGIDNNNYKKSYREDSYEPEYPDNNYESDYGMDNRHDSYGPIPEYPSKDTDRNSYEPTDYTDKNSYEPTTTTTSSYENDNNYYNSYESRDYGMDNNDRKSYGMDSYKSQYPSSYKPDYKSEYSSYVKDDRRDKSKDSKSVDINKLNCINTNLNINGNNAGNVSIGNKGQGYLGAYSSADGGYGGEYDGQNKKGKGIECIINNNNNNINLVSGGNQTEQLTCEECFTENLSTEQLNNLTIALSSSRILVNLEGLCKQLSNTTLTNQAKLIGLTFLFIQAGITDEDAFIRVLKCLEKLGLIIVPPDFGLPNSMR